MVCRKTSTERVKRFQARQRERREFVREVVDKDVQVFVEQTQWGTLRITWDMSQETHAALERFCADKGFTLDDLLSDVNVESLAKASRDAKAGKLPQRLVTRAGPDRHYKSRRRAVCGRRCEDDEGSANQSGA